MPAAQAQTHSFQTKAPHLIIMDHESGSVLFEKSARAPMAPASMTKIMTAAVVFDQLKSGAITLEQKFTVSPDAWRRGGARSGSSTMFLDPNSEVSVENLLRGAIIQSGNDASIALAQGIAGSEAGFAQLMNDKAQEIGLSSANFNNSTGWPSEGHVISAYDLAQLSRYMIHTYPELYKIFGEESFRWNKIKQGNRNPLLMAGSEGADGLKTGSTTDSGFGLAGTAVRAGNRRIIVLNGMETSKSRRAEALRVMDAAFAEFRVLKAASGGRELARADVHMGVKDTVPLISKTHIFVGVPAALAGKVKTRVEYNGPLSAPLTAGAPVAQLVISVPGRADETHTIYTASAVERLSLPGQLVAAIKQQLGG